MPPKRKIEKSQSQSSINGFSQQVSEKSNQRLSTSSTKLSKSPLDHEDSNTSEVKAARRHQKFSERIYVEIDGETDAVFMKSFIKEGSTGYGICEICSELNKTKTGRNKPYLIATENIYNHIQTDSHRTQTKAKDLDKLDNLISAIKLKKKTKSEAKMNIKDHTKEYLEFIALLLRERLSFSQINHIGSYLKKMQEQNKLGFLSIKRFDEEELSRATNCMGDSIINKLKKELETAKYSFCIDSATIAGENICALKVRYQTQMKDDCHLPIQKTQNRIIGIKTLQGSSTGEVYFNIAEEVLNLDSAQSNLVGLSHDNASCLSGQFNGLYGLIRKKKHHYFFDLPDPCHCLNLTLHDSIEALPKDLMKFVDKIHHYFNFPQRKAKLAIVQRRLGQEKQLLCHYVETRWLSLGLSLERLLQIWPSLTEYMKIIKEDQGLSAKDRKYYLEHLEDRFFFLQILSLSKIVNRINESNTLFQSQTLEIQHLKHESSQLLRWIARLVIPPEKIPKEITEVFNIQLNTENSEKEWFMEEQKFISNVIEKIDVRFEEFLKLDIITAEQKTNFFSMMCAFIKKLLIGLQKYSPLKKDLVQWLDFVELKGESYEIEEKILKFNDLFGVIPKEQKPKLVDEIMRLLDLNLTRERAYAKNSSLYLWDLVQRTSDFELLPSVFGVAHALPTSSASVEQAFSFAKLVKTAIRNRLSEHTLQSILMICEEYKEVRNGETIEISNEMIGLP